MNTALDQQSSKPHPTQVALLLKALELVKVGGRVVFSTCSLNPIENEAVVAAAMLWGRGGGGGEAGDGGMHWVRLVDVEGEVEGLKWMPGLREWKVSYTKQVSV